MIEIQKAKFLPHVYHLISDGVYVVFDKVIVSEVDNIHFYNDDRFVCLIDYTQKDAVLKALEDQKIGVTQESLLL
tara:strand:+ start:208 stop:432 length:225 start_codon:yes stop_codon:yes gene_type:complete